MSKAIERLKCGINTENPTFVQMLGMCPTMAVTTSAVNGIGMGLTTTVILILSNMMISALRKVIPDKVRIPAYITIIAGFVTIIQMFVKGFVPAIDSALGVYLPLITTNCAVLGVALTNVQKEYDFVTSVVNGIGTSVGFTIAIVIMAGIRERNADNTIIKPLQGMPIVLFTAALMAIAFNGFAGLI